MENSNGAPDRIQRAGWDHATTHLYVRGTTSLSAKPRGQSDRFGAHIEGRLGNDPRNVFGAFGDLVNVWTERISEMGYMGDGGPQTSTAPPLIKQRR